MKKSKILNFPTIDRSSPFNTPEMRKMLPRFLAAFIKSSPFKQEGADLISEFANQYNEAVHPEGPFLEPRSPEMMHLFMKILETMFINWMRFTFQSHDLKADPALPQNVQKEQIKLTCLKITKHAIEDLQEIAPFVLDGMQGLEGHDYPLQRAARLFDNNEDDSTNHPRH